MKLEDLKRWIVDTISEGGYSFKELYEYILSHDIRTDDFLSAIREASEANLIVVYVSTPHSEDKISLDQSNQKETIDNYVSLRELESKIGSRHYFDLTREGLEYLERDPDDGPSD
ncbi:MAG: hypothetical protein AAB288_08045 [Acidobacteriota bacterium]